MHLCLLNSREGWLSWHLWVAFLRVSVSLDEHAGVFIQPVRECWEGKLVRHDLRLISCLTLGSGVI